MQDCQLGPELNRPGKMSIGRFQRYLIEIIPSSKSLDFAALLYTGLYFGNPSENLLLGNPSAITLAIMAVQFSSSVLLSNFPSPH